MQNIVEEKGITFSASDILDLDMELAQTTKSKESEKKKGERLRLCLHVAFFSPLFRPFTNGFNALLWCCLHMMLKDQRYHCQKRSEKRCV